MSLSLSRFFLLIAIALPACAVESAAQDEASDADMRQPIGKADLIGSCADEDGNHCGDRPGGEWDNCWCDVDCVVMGDCCADKADVCDPGDDDGADMDDGTSPPVEPTTCEDAHAQLEAERLAVSACTTADECGQPMPGPGCGCTQAPVARLDADISAYEAGLQTMGELCGPLPAGPCVCPPADGFLCDDGQCKWNLR